MPKRTQQDDAGRNVRPRVDTKLPLGPAAAVTQAAAASDTTKESAAVQAFIKELFVPSDPDSASAVASWCADRRLEEPLVHVVNTVGLSELKIADTALAVCCLNRC